MNINNVKARQIIDSRGTPTVEAEVWGENGMWGRASVPSGASIGDHEAYELRDGGESFGGKGVLKAVENIIGEIQEALKGVSVLDQEQIDTTMIDLDGTPQKSRLGANAILAVSLASAHAAARLQDLPLYRYINSIAGEPKMSLPMPMMNVFNGGRHAFHSSNFQEYMIIPAGAGNYAEAVRMTAEIVARLKQIIEKGEHLTTVGDEGGFAFQVKSNIEILDLLLKAVSDAGYNPGREVLFGLDIAASELLKDGMYHLSAENKVFDSESMISYLEEVTERYPVRSIEDGLAEDDWGNWPLLTDRLKGMQLVGDDLLVTNKERLKKAIQEKAGNSILIKPNQIGTLTETIETVQEAQKNGWNTVMSHRSGETEDVTIAHLAVGLGTGQIKTGNVVRGERTAKHNELIRIEEAGKIPLARPF